MDGHAGRTVAVVPLKALHRAKGRLAADLSSSARRELVAWMLSKVLEACRDAATIDDLVVVAGDEHGAALARGAGAAVLREHAPGLDAALAVADAALTAAAATLVVAADLPLATAADLDAVCAAAGPGPGVVVAPTADGGTAALFRRPGGVITPSYGVGSADRHLARAEAAGVPAVRLELERLALDVDTPEQLAALRRTGFRFATPGA